MSPESPEVQVILKDKFITQSAPDIRRKLQKVSYGPEQNLESLLKVAISVFYNRDKEEKRDWNRRDNRKAEALVTALQRVNFGPPRLEKGRPTPGTGPRATCLVCGREGHFKRECPMGWRSKSPTPCPLCQGDHWKQDCPQRRRQLGSDLQQCGRD